jgi:hypothetical protein
LKRFLNDLAASWTRAKKRRGAPAAKRTARLGVERLEAREVPTVFFTPHFGGFAVDRTDWTGNALPVNNNLPDPSQTALKSPQGVFVIFSNNTTGSNPWDWNKNALAEQDVIAAVDRIISGHYLDKLHQYGYDIGSSQLATNPATGQNLWVDRLMPEQADAGGVYPFDNTEKSLNSYLFGPNGDDGALGRDGIPLSNPGEPFNAAPIYVIVTPPDAQVLPDGITAANRFFPGGPNRTDQGSVVCLETQSLPSNRQAIDMDDFTTKFSREITEAISHELQLDPNSQELTAGFGTNAQGPADGRAQLADFETADGRYTVRLDNGHGDLVQAYWSVEDNSFVVPDGNAQDTHITPIWTAQNKFHGLQEDPADVTAAGIDDFPPAQPVVQQATDEVTLFNTSVNHAFYKIRGDGDNNVFISMSTDGTHFSNERQMQGFQARGSAIAVFNNRLFIAWTDTDSPDAFDPEGRVHVAQVILDPSSGVPTSFVKNVQDLKDPNGDQTVSDNQPALVSFDNALFLAWSGSDNFQNQLFVDFVTPENMTWGRHRTQIPGTTEKNPKLTDDKQRNRLLLNFEGGPAPAGGGDFQVELKLLLQQTSHLVSSSLAGGTLTVAANHFPWGDDHFALDGIANGGLRVTVNGTATDYARGSISAIVFDTGMGNSTIDVHAVDQNVPVTINALGHTTVNVGSNGSMRPIQGSLSVLGSPHAVDLTLDAHRDRGDAILLQSQDGVETVSGMSQSSAIHFGKSDLATFTLDTFGYGGAVSFYDTPDTIAPTDLNLYGRASRVYVYGTTGALNVNGQGGQDTVTVYPAGFGRTPTVANTIKGVVHVTNPAGSTTLVVNARNDASDHPNVTLDSGRLSGMAGADITWQPTARSTGGVTSLAVYGGTGNNTFNVAHTDVLSGGATELDPGNGTGTDVVNIEHTSGALTVGLGTGGNVVNVSPTAQTLDNIQGRITVTGSTGYDRLWVYDTSTTGNYNYVLPGTSVWRATRFRGGSTVSMPIDYSALSEIHLSGGTGQEAFVVQDTAFLAGTYLTTNSKPTSDPRTQIGSQVFVSGTSGSLFVTGASGPASVLVGTTTFTGFGPRGGSTNGHLNGIKGSILVNATGGQVSLDVNDSADASSPSAVLGPHRALFGPPGHVLAGQESIMRLAPAAISYYGDVVTPTIDLGSGTLTVEITGARPTTINAAAATVNVGDTANTLDGIRGGLTINGQGKNTTLNVNDSGTLTAENYTVYADHMQRSVIVGGVYQYNTPVIGYHQVGHVMVEVGQDKTGQNQGGLYNTLDVMGTAPGTDTSLYGNSSGQTQFAVYPWDGPPSNQILGPVHFHAGSGGLDTVGYFDYFDPSPATFNLTAGQIAGPSFATVTYDGPFYSAGVTTSAYAKAGSHVNVLSTSPTWTVVQANAGDTVTVGSQAPAVGGGTLAGLNGLLTIGSVNPTKSAKVILDDSADTQTGKQVAFNTDSYAWGVSGLGPHRIYLNLGTGSSIQVLGGSPAAGQTGGNTYDIQSTPAGTSLQVTAGSGTDTINVGGATAQTLDSILGAVTVNGQGANTTLNYNDQNTRASNYYWYYVNANSLARKQIFYTSSGQTYSPLEASVNFGAIGTLNVHSHNASAAAGSSYFAVTGTTLGTTTHIYAGAGINEFFVTGNNYVLDSMQGPLFLHGSGPGSPNDNLVFIEDSLDPKPQRFLLTAGATSESGTVQRFSPGSPQLNMAAINYDGMNAYAVLATANSYSPSSSHNDTVDIQGNAADLWTIVAVGTGDTVNVGTTAHTMDGIAGDLRIQAYAGQTPTVNFDDSGDTANRTIDLADEGSGYGYRVTGLLSPGNPVRGRIWLLDPAMKVSLKTGVGNDVFRVHDSKEAPALTLDGGGGSNWLDYSDYGSGVTVNLAAGTATGLAGISRIENVVGSRFNDTLIGDAANNVLIGLGGNDSLQAGSGRAILIGGDGNSTLQGGSGQEDILIGGWTTYDRQLDSSGAVQHVVNYDALDALMAEWASSDSLAARQQALASGVGSGRWALNAATVSDDGVADTLSRNGGLDWIFAGRNDTVS